MVDREKLEGRRQMEDRQRKGEKRSQKQES